MKLVLFTYLFFSQTLIAQQIDTSAILAHAQGIKTTRLTYYQVEGYKVFVEIIKGKPDEKGLNKIRRAYAIKNETHITRNDVHLFTTTMDHEDSIKEHNTYFVTTLPDNRMQVVGFQTLIERDTLLEQFFWNIIANDRMPGEVMTAWEVDTINFAGRPIDLGPACRWMEVRSVQCTRAGQFNWAEFSSQAQAEQMIRVAKAFKQNISTITEEKEVMVLFEGQQTTATRKRVKVKLPKLLMGGSNELIIYYVTAKVRGRYIGCVLSHYSDEAKEGELPPLLSEVMQLVK